MASTRGVPGDVQLAHELVQEQPPQALRGPRVAGEQCPFDHFGQVDQGEDRLVEIGDVAAENVLLLSAEGLHGVGEHARITLRRHRRVRRGPSDAGSSAPTTPRRRRATAVWAASRVPGSGATWASWRTRSMTWRTLRTKSPGAMSVSRSTESRVAPLAQAITARARPGSGRRVRRRPTRRSSARSPAARASSRASRSTTATGGARGCRPRPGGPRR